MIIGVQNQISITFGTGKKSHPTQLNFYLIIHQNNPKIEQNKVF